MRFNVSKTGLCKSSCGLSAPKSSPKIPIPSIPLGDIVEIWLRVSLSFRTALNAPNESPPIKRKFEFKRQDRFAVACIKIQSQSPRVCNGKIERSLETKIVFIFFTNA